jgi:glutaredoxin
MITVYGKNNCPSCNKLKAFFEDKGVSIQYINIDTNPADKEKFLEFGIMSVPVTVIGDEKLVGWSDNVKEKLEKYI